VPILSATADRKVHTVSFHMCLDTHLFTHKYRVVQNVKRLKKYISYLMKMYNLLLHRN